MIGVLLVTHGNVCESLKESMEMILGQQKNFCALSLNPEDDVMELKNRVKAVSYTHLTRCLLQMVAPTDSGAGIRK